MSELELEGFGEFEGAELLQKLHLFQKLGFEETRRLAAIIEYVDLPAGTVVIEQNALGDALWIVARGQVSVSRDADLDGRHTASEEIGRLGPGELFGEMSLVDDVLTSARVSTTSDCRLLKLPRRRFEALLDSDERLAAKVYRSFCRTLSDRLRKTTSLLAAKQAMGGVVR